MCEVLALCTRPLCLLFCCHVVYRYLRCVCCRVIMEMIVKHEEAWPFLLPVDGRRFPSYRKIIRKPMDFQTIGTKLRNNKYVHTPTLILSDLWTHAISSIWLSVFKPLPLKKNFLQRVVTKIKKCTCNG